MLCNVISISQLFQELPSKKLWDLSFSFVFKAFLFLSFFPAVRLSSLIYFYLYFICIYLQHWLFLKCRCKRFQNHGHKKHSEFIGYWARQVVNNSLAKWWMERAEPVIFTHRITLFLLPAEFALQQHSTHVSSHSYSVLVRNQFLLWYLLRWLGATKQGSKRHTGWNCKFRPC